MTFMGIQLVTTARIVVLKVASITVVIFPVRNQLEDVFKIFHSHIASVLKKIKEEETTAQKYFV